jgi:RND family efflux transporter MFP subunit
MMHVPMGEMNGVVDRLRGAALRDDGAPTDGHLLEAFIARGDSPAFDALVRRHAAMVLAVCRRIAGHAHDADDAFQATFLVLVRKAGSVMPRDLVGNWLYGVAYRTALKARALAGRRHQRERRMIDIPQPDANAEDRTELLRLLDRELARLPAKYRLPIVLCDLEGRTRRNAARQLGLPTGTLSGRLTIARKLLAKRLGRHGLAITGTALGNALSEQAVAGAPNEIVTSTIKAAALFAAGSAAAAGIIPTQATALAEGVLKTMLLGKLKIATAVLASIVLLGAGVLAYDGAGPGGQQPPAREAPKQPSKRDTIEDAQAKADLAAAKARVDLATIDVNQAEVTLRKAQQQLAAAQAEYELVRQRRAKEVQNPAPPPAKPNSNRGVMQVVGYLQAGRVVQVTSAVAGIVTEVSVREGDIVRAGQLLATLDARPLQAEVDRAKVNVELAQARLQEAKALKSDPNVYDATVAARIQVAEAELKRSVLDLNQAKAQLEKARLYAPIEGIVAKRQVEVGDTINPAQGPVSRLFELIDPRSLLVSVSIPERDLSAVGVGQRVLVETNALPGKSLEGKVARIAPVVDPATASVIIQIGLNVPGGDPRWKPGMAVRVSFQAKE